MLPYALPDLSINQPSPRQPITEEVSSPSDRTERERGREKITQSNTASSNSLDARELNVSVMTSQSPLIPLLVTLLSLGRFSSGQWGSLNERQVWPGGSVTLPCPVPAGSINGTSFEWLKESFAIAGTNTTTPNARVSTDKDYSLKIKNTTPQDSGIYTCVVSDAERRSEAPVRLTVGVSQTIITQDPGSVTGTEEGEVTLPCTLSRVGPPGPVIWYRDTGRGREYLYSTYPPLPNERNDPRVSLVHQNHRIDVSIRIVRLTLHDSGMYYCYKYRGFEETTIARGSGSSLSVQALPPPIITQDPGPVTGTEEGEVTLPCTLSTVGAAGPVRWYRGTLRDRQHLYSAAAPPPNERNDPRVSRVHPDHPTDLSIRIVRLTLHDSGTYYCDKYRGFDGSQIAGGTGTWLRVQGECVAL
ncbi:tyrosine-protein phosphatase non-receptor type substrate 1-like [Acipenser oxyrinchus oxyrinchus]|uniref:Tyrosine-protein phosphatase non-receptor type substrate 1-like n=1 Tax=Acipenser oxyrinchus oxyrinchus TaxID=40147 RepID=A0AAD8FPJ4_ACIOX|nr:tyrosine-protein phosphatase non-receptor type substrate 1-like [Acipenser oxyrinchus oxyrinchus]